MQPLDCIKDSHRNAYLIVVNLASMLKCVTLAQFTKYDSVIYWSYNECLLDVDVIGFEECFYPLIFVIKFYRRLAGVRNLRKHR